MLGVFIREKVWPENSPSQTFSRINTPIFGNLVILHTYPLMKMEQSVPKRRHIKFRRRELPRRKHTTFRTRRKFIIMGYVFFQLSLRCSYTHDTYITVGWHDGQCHDL